ncbi:uncharacterized protein LOC106876164 isoform X1 [Octopus bimaculoides]|uniref:uncharacterized protein LOC106876164 isoform X1 n=1 Tax=Octopus bimaculoides TaxID=37653 RepID=UPI00071C3815|nr:uncharacterized protein LOC106876164 isoform X1 [Octopus bimaculoides]|eukprot:XP_014780076.1 PREDICTED: uncharacterized protein LOC106876164 isoform X1 [Octopus bimaculoides]
MLNNFNIVPRVRYYCTQHTWVSVWLELLLYSNLILACHPQRQTVPGVSGEIKEINGLMVDVQDNCDPGNKDSCSPGYCCVKEVIAYRPQYKGQKAAYKQACRRMRREGEFCMPEDALHICPCNKGFECQAEDEMDYGHCRRIKKPENEADVLAFRV